MRIFSCNGRLALVYLAIALGLLPAMLYAGERHAKKSTDSNSDTQTVEMFDAIENGQIEVKLVQKDSTQANVVVKNKTDQPLNIKLPDAFAGIPVLAQRTGNSGGSSNNSSQSTGGSMGGMGGGGGGMFNVAPEKVGQFHVTTVCLEHGKAEPQATVKYEVKPIESFTSNTSVQELCRMMGNGQLNQRAAQAAAWHLCNNMSWEELSAKKLHHIGSVDEPYFSREELQAAMQIAATAVRTAETNKAEKQNSNSGYSEKN